MLRFPRRVAARLVALLRADPAGLRAGFLALVISTLTGLVAGLVLGSIADRLAELPGLIILIPAAVGMRGNVFGALGSRFGTALHAGTFRLSRRIDTLCGQNIAVAVLLSMSLSLLLALVAKGFAVTFGIHNAISVADYVVVAVLGGLVPTFVAIGITLVVASLSTRREWDLDNVHVPIVTATGDMVTLPSLFLAAELVAVDGVTPVVATLCAAVSLACLVVGWRSRHEIIRRVMRESIGVAVLAGCVSMLAGLTIDGRLDTLVALPALLVALPAMLSLCGSLAGILSSRLTTKLHLGLVEVGRGSWRRIAEDIALTYVFAVALFVMLAVFTEVFAAVLSIEAPATFALIGAILLAGLLATTLANVVGYLGAFVTYRYGWDPDNFGIPLVTSTSDLVGAASFMLVIAVFGFA